MAGRLPQAVRYGLNRLFWVLASASVVAGSIGAPQALAEPYLVSDQQAYNDALKRLQPGDELILANGTWQNFEIAFEAVGTKDQPISLRAETPGEVIISGRSSLQIGGEHLVVSGLTFTAGHSPGSAVIAFRSAAGRLANHTRLTQTVITNFSKPERPLEDQWVALSGRNNRVDHNYFAGKTNKGPTLIVRLDALESQANQHLVEFNFFGHRPSIGGNGGETIRVGVSDFSRTRSETRVVRNYFERCDGEVEIISIKSEGNLVAENVFYESRGAVVFRHGGSNEISRNIFFGNEVSDTGGVRVINDKQTVKDNYFEGLRGEKFLSALTIMNGVPNSPINRYHQVKDALVANNSFIGFVALGLAVGSDEERSAPPIDSVVRNNLFITDSKAPVSVFDDISGISFENNLSANPAMSDYATITPREIKLARAANGLLYPTDKALAAVGAPRDLEPLARDKTGPDWFDKPAQAPAADHKKRVKKGAAALQRAVAESQPGDVLRLRGKKYVLDQPLVISHALTIKGRARISNQTVLSSEGAALFKIVAGGALTLNNVELAGSRKNKAVIVAAGDRYEGAYSLRLKDVVATADDGVSKLSFLVADPATFATSIELDRVSTSNWPGAFIALSGAGLDGWYLAEDIKIRNSSFRTVDGPVINFSREGRDESTFGPRVVLQNSKLSQVNPNGFALQLDGVDGLVMQGNGFKGSGKLHIKKRVLGLKFITADNEFEDSPTPEIFGVEGEVLAGAATRALPIGSK